MVFIGKGVEIHCDTRTGCSWRSAGWVHIGDKNTIRAHEGSLRFGDKVVLGRDNVINCYPRHRARGLGTDVRLVLCLRFRPPHG